MAGKTREIKGRIKAVGNIERITKTMQMIATAQFQAMQKQATQAADYTRKITEVVAEVTASLSAGDVSSPLVARPGAPGADQGEAAGTAGRQLLLVVTSNRGLCGAYNANVLRAAMAFIRQRGAQTVGLEVVGKKGLGFFRFNRLDVDASHAEFGDRPRYADTERLAERYIQSFTEGACDSVRVAYMAFHSASKQSPQLIQLLPLQNPGAGAGDPGAGAGARPSAAVYEFSPPPAELLDELLPIAVKTRLYQCFNEAAVSEQLARMVAMKAATDSANKMGKDLSRKYNRARQAAITTELSEIIGGAAALE